MTSSSASKLKLIYAKYNFVLIFFQMIIIHLSKFVPLIKTIS